MATTINDRAANDRAASEYLHSLGIRGIKYLDGLSRAADTQPQRIAKMKTDLAYREDLLKKESLLNGAEWVKDKTGLAEEWRQRIVEMKDNLAKV